MPAGPNPWRARPLTKQVGRNRGLPRSRRDDAREHRPHRREACLTFDNQNVVGEQQPNQAESTAPGRLIPDRVVVDGVAVLWLETPAPARPLPLFGVGGPGLLDFDELGLRWLGPEPINQWGQDRFTAGNAALWLSGPVPENLKLNLRPGTRKPLPELSQLPYKTPAVYQQGDRWVL